MCWKSGGKRLAETRLVLADRFGQEVHLLNPCVEPWLIYALGNTPLCDIQHLLDSIQAVYDDGTPVPHGSLSVGIISR